VLVLVVGTGVGVALAGAPSSNEEGPLKLVATSVVTSTTVAVPAESPAAAADALLAVPPFPGSFGPGATGGAVRQWQQRMKDRGWAVDVDGRFGSGAAEICRRFQAQKGLDVNGTVDEATWDATWSAALPDQTG
jgi:peptidoglycan hydrolase-like protein with peptidoglycan-binding domain